MKTKLLVTINNLNDIKKLKKVGITTFLFALKNYSQGYEKTFSIDEINKINEKKYILINKLLNCKEIDELKKIIFLTKCDGIIFEDIGLLSLLKDFKGDKILFMNHFNCNHESINEWLKEVDSVILSNELTYKEYESITNNVDKDIILHVFGYNQVMNSKRHLLNNFYEQFSLKQNNFTEIKDKFGNTKFKILDEDVGTTVYSSKIFDGRRLLNLKNIKYFYINSSFIDIETILSFINNEIITNTDEGFLDKPTIYKLKEVKK